MARTAKRVEEAVHALFEQVMDTIRDAARIPQDRRLTPAALRSACAYGVDSLFGG
jgi:hypothetical protein